MEQDKPVHSGILLLPPHGKILLKKTWQPKYCQLYRSSKFGIQRLEIFNSSDENLAKFSTSTPRIITLESCIKITQRSDTSFVLITKMVSQDFATTTNQSLMDWLVALQSVAFEASKASSIEEDNELYCSSGEGVFNVKLHSSEASIRCGLEPQHYILVFTSTAIQLKNSDDDKLLFTWPYMFIRRYGYKDGQFIFEAGRKCDSGEGFFNLGHSNDKQIFRCFESKIKLMKKLLHAESTTSVLECGDNPFQAALSMEARSRSPLPPSPATSTSLQDIESHTSSVSSKATEFSLDKQFANSVSKITPPKPPRKYVASPTSKLPSQHDAFQAYELVNKYDDVERRFDAWRTMGTDDIKHTEHVDDDEELEEYVSWGRDFNQVPTPLGSSDVPVQKPSPKIITTPVLSENDDDNYDRLNFFGPSCKLSSGSKAGYKQVTPVGTISQPATLVPVPQPSPPSFNDYDEVVPTMESVRIADDSHLGYAVVRKTSRDPVDHQFHNDDPYAVISKAKRV